MFDNANGAKERRQEKESFVIQVFIKSCLYEISLSLLKFKNLKRRGWKMFVFWSPIAEKKRVLKDDKFNHFSRFYFMRLKSFSHLFRVFLKNKENFIGSKRFRYLGINDKSILKRETKLYMYFFESKESGRLSFRGNRELFLWYKGV